MDTRTVRIPPPIAQRAPWLSPGHIMDPQKQFDRVLADLSAIRGLELSDMQRPRFPVLASFVTFRASPGHELEEVSGRVGEYLRAAYVLPGDPANVDRVDQVAEGVSFGLGLLGALIPGPVGAGFRIAAGIAEEVDDIPDAIGQLLEGAPSDVVREMADVVSGVEAVVSKKEGGEKSSDSLAARIRKVGGAE
jgi:hypothetical protein